jgi:hypothetical protein
MNGLPLEAMDYVNLDAIAQRYACLPSQVLEADAFNFKVATIASLAQRKDPEQ